MIARGGCLGISEDTCPAFRKFRTCEGCPHEAVKRPTDWRPSLFSVEVRRVADLVAEGISVSLADLSPLVVEGMVERREVLNELDAAEVARRQQENDRESYRERRKAMTEAGHGGQ